MRLSADEVRRVAALARLDLGHREAEALAAQLGDILERIDRLDDAASSTPNPGAGAPAADGPTADDGDADGSRLRRDEPGADPLAAEPSTMAPEWVDGFFTVPRLPSHGGGGPGEEAP